MKRIQRLLTQRRYGVEPHWSEKDYFKLVHSREECYTPNTILAEATYRIALMNNMRVNMFGNELIGYMLRVAGSLFIPHVLARITFLKPERTNDADFSN